MRSWCSVKRCIYIFCICPPGWSFYSILETFLCVLIKLCVDEVRSMQDWKKKDKKALWVKKTHERFFRLWLFNVDYLIMHVFVHIICYLYFQYVSQRKLGYFFCLMGFWTAGWFFLMMYDPLKGHFCNLSCLHDTKEKIPQVLVLRIFLPLFLLAMSEFTPSNSSARGIFQESLQTICVHRCSLNWWI